jgi:hypothetical protein
MRTCFEEKTIAQQIQTCKKHSVPDIHTLGLCRILKNGLNGGKDLISSQMLQGLQSLHPKELAVAESSEHRTTRPAVALGEAFGGLYNGASKKDRKDLVMSLQDFLGHGRR